MAEKVLTAVMQDPYIQGVSIRSVDELVQAEVPGLKAIVMNFLGSKVIIVCIRSLQGDRLRHLDVVPRPLNKSTTACPWGQSAATRQMWKQMTIRSINERRIDWSARISSIPWSSI